MLHACVQTASEETTWRVSECVSSVTSLADVACEKRRKEKLEHCSLKKGTHKSNNSVMIVIENRVENRGENRIVTREYEEQAQSSAVDESVLDQYKSVSEKEQSGSQHKMNRARWVRFRTKMFRRWIWKWFMTMFEEIVDQKCSLSGLKIMVKVWQRLLYVQKLILRTYHRTSKPLRRGGLIGLSGKCARRRIGSLKKNDI